MHERPFPQCHHADRKKLKSANGMYLGSTGSGKSFAAKRELLNVFLTIPQDRIIIVDPMGEYAPLVRRLGGQVIEIAPDSPHHLNPMDVELNMAAGESPLSMKADFLLSLCELVVGGKEGLQPIEKTVVDRCVRLVYREQALGLDTGKTPLLQDLYEELLKQPEPEPGVWQPPLSSTAPAPSTCLTIPRMRKPTAGWCVSC